MASDIICARSNPTHTGSAGPCSLASSGPTCVSSASARKDVRSAPDPSELVSATVLASISHSLPAGATSGHSNSTRHTPWVLEEVRLSTECASSAFACEQCAERAQREATSPMSTLELLRVSVSSPSACADRFAHESIAEESTRRVGSGAWRGVSPRKFRWERHPGWRNSEETVFLEGTVHPARLRFLASGRGVNCNGQSSTTSGVAGAD